MARRPPAAGRHARFAPTGGYYPEKKPVVLVNRDVYGLPRNNIQAEDGITEAVFHLQSLGHSKIAYLAGPKGFWSNQQRQSAVTAASQQLEIGVVVIELGRPDGS